MRWGKLKLSNGADIGSTFSGGNGSGRRMDCLFRAELRIPLGPRRNRYHTAIVFAEAQWFGHIAHRDACTFVIARVLPTRQEDDLHIVVDEAYGDIMALDIHQVKGIVGLMKCTERSYIVDPSWPDPT